MRIFDYSSRNDRWEAISAIEVKKNQENLVETISCKRVPVEDIGYKLNNAEKWGNLLETPARKLHRYFKYWDYIEPGESGKFLALKVAAVIAVVLIALPILFPITNAGSFLCYVGAKYNEMHKGISDAEDKIFEVEIFYKSIYDYNSKIKGQSAKGFLGMTVAIEQQLNVYLTDKFPDIANEDAKREWITEFRKKWNIAINELHKDEKIDLRALNNHFEADTQGALMVQVIDQHFQNLDGDGSFKERIDGIFKIYKSITSLSKKIEERAYEFNQIMQPMLTKQIPQY